MCRRLESLAMSTRSLLASSTPKFAYPSHVCVTSNGQLCVSFTGSNQLILCEVDGRVIVRIPFQRDLRPECTSAIDRISSAMVTLGWLTATFSRWNSIHRTDSSSTITASMLLTRTITPFVWYDELLNGARAMAARFYA